MYQNIFYDRLKNEVYLWDDENIPIKFPYRKYAYRRSSVGKYKSLYGDSLEKIYHFDERDTDLFESDIQPELRILTDAYPDNDEPSQGHRIIIFDIEVDSTGGFPDVTVGDKVITSIALYDYISSKYFIYVLDPENKITLKGHDNVIINGFSNEKKLLNSFINKWKEINPTIISGWNTNSFDIPYLFNRSKLVLGKDKAYSLSPINIAYQNKFNKKMVLAGISCLDYIDLYKKFLGITKPSYSLQAVSQDEELKIQKIIYKGSLNDLYKNDLNRYVEYNLADVGSIVELDKKYDFIFLARSVCHKGHIPYEWFQMSSRFIDGAILMYLHRNNRIAPNKPIGGKEKYEEMEREGEEGFSGAYVKEPTPGLYDWICSADITSLYPSTIMSLNISPEKKLGKISGWNYEEFKSGKMEKIQIGETNYSIDEFKEFLKDYKISISSNGIIYSQEKVGVVPKILDIWFKERVQYRELAKKYKKEGNIEKSDFYNRRQLRQKIFLNCFSPDTKVITPSGIKYIYELKIGDLVYSLNTTNGNTEIKPITKVYEYDYNGNMVHFQSRHIDFLITPNHRFWVSQIKENEKCFFDWKYASDIIDDINDIKFPSVDVLYIKKSNNILKSKHKKIVPYIGKVYCVTVQDNHTLLCGRNDKYQWSGQSIYGTLGLPVFRFYDRDNAEATTTSGQTIIKSAEKLVNDFYKNKFINSGKIPPKDDFVEYLDTDSVYISASPLATCEEKYPEDMEKYTIELINTISNKINEHYKIMIPEVFNVHPDNNRIKIVSDVIAEKALWIAKKRYAMLKVFDMENMMCVKDKAGNRGKLEVKGIDTVRSSFPKAFRKMASIVLEMLLRGKSQSDIDEKILNFEETMENVTIFDMGKTTSVKFISHKGDTDYDPRKRNSFNFEKKTPVGVKSALGYNDLLKIFGLNKKTEPILHGQKIKWIYLLPNEYGLESLALKGDDTDPDKIIEFAEKYIDRKAMYDAELKSKLKEIYSVIKWDYPNRATEFVKKFFNSESSNDW